MSTFGKTIKATKIYKRINKWWHTFTIPGFEGVPFYDVTTFLFKEIKRDSVNIRAGSVAFNFLLATFPAIIFLFTLIAYIPIQGFTTTLLHSIKAIMPETTYSATHETIEDILKHHRGGLLSFGLILALFYSLSGVRSLMNAFNKSHPTFRRRSVANKYWISLKITILLMLGLIVSITLIVSGKFIIHLVVNWLHVKWKTARLLINIVNWVFTTLFLYFSISLIYFYGPAAKVRWRFWSAGSTLATALSILTSLAFTIFVDFIARYNKIYGSIGTLMVVMLWYYFNAFSLLIGFELNTSIDVNKHLRDERSKIVAKKPVTK